MNASSPLLEPVVASAAGARKAAGERSFLRTVLGSFARHRPAMVCTVLLGVLLLFGFVLPLFWPYGYTVDREIPPDLAWFTDWDHPFGTDSLGHDLTAQLMRGTRNSLLVGFTAAALSTGLALVVGVAAGYFRGVVDMLLMRLVDVILVIPFLVVVLVAAGALDNPTWWMIAILIGLFAWTIDSRVVRGQVLAVREREFIEASRSLGATDWWLISRHVFPNIVGTLTVVFTLSVANAIAVESVLAFLGFGISTPDVSLGFLIDDARTAVRTRPWLFYSPGLLIVLIILSVSFIGDGLRDSLDPKKVRR